MLDLNRLKLLAEEPVRAAMPRTTQYPSMSAKLQRQRQEIEALRRGIRESVIEIEQLRGQVRDLQNLIEEDVIREFGP